MEPVNLLEYRHFVFSHTSPWDCKGKYQNIPHYTTSLKNMKQTKILESVNLLEYDTQVSSPLWDEVYCWSSQLISRHQKVFNETEI